MPTKLRVRSSLLQHCNKVLNVRCCRTVPICRRQKHICLKMLGFFQKGWRHFTLIIPGKSWVKKQVGIEKFRFLNKRVDTKQPTERVASQNFVGTSAIVLLDIRHELIANESAECIRSARTRMKTPIEFRLCWRR